MTLSVALAWVCLACGRPPAEGPARNLILISIDTLRADRLGSYGYPRPTSPALDALAARGARFETVIAESNWTLPSHVTLFSGLEPYDHGVNLPTLRLVSDVPTLPEILQRHGFHTVAATGGGFLSRRYGFERGFDSFPDAELRFDAALAEVERRIDAVPRDERFFAFVHTYDVHCPYDPPEAYARRFASESAEWIETRDRCGDSHFNALHLSAGQFVHVSDRYDAGIRRADDQLGAFLERLERAGRLEDTLVAVVSDHGEAFGEHGRIGHQAMVYIEALRVPWIVAGPGIARTVIARPVGLSHVLPTLLALLGVDDPAADARLVPALRGEPAAADPAGGEGAPRTSLNVWKGTLVSVVDGDRHAVYDKRAMRFQVFDWRADPTEQVDLAGRERERDLAMQERMIGPVLTRSAPGPARFERIEPPAQSDLERLHALGYAD